MKLYYLISWAAVFYGMLSINIAHAGAWNLKPGEGQIISSYDYSKANSAFSDIEFEDAPLVFSKNEGRIFYEHGLTKDLTFVGNAAHQTVQFSGLQSQINFSDFADIELGLRYQIARKEGLAVALQGSYIVGGGPPSSILDVNGPDDSFELRGLWGQSKEFEKFGLFADAQLAIRAAKLDKLDEWHSDLTLGYKRGEKYMLLAQIFHANREPFGRDGFTVEAQRRTKVKTSIVYQYKPNRLVQIGYQETIAGRNIVREKGLSVGTWLRY